MTRENETYQYKINELRFDFNNPKTKNKIFILLEGDSDVRLYRKLYTDERFRIEYIPGGKLSLEKGLQELKSLFDAIIGIRDADFAHLENQQPCLPNLFFTDFHDSEMLMVASVTTFSAVLHEFCRLPETEHEDLRKKLLTALRFVSYFRWLNELRCLAFSFEGATFEGIFLPNDFSIANQKFAEQIAGKSKNAKIKEIDVILEEISKLANEYHEDFQLCNGHDFMSVLASFLRTKCKDRPSAKSLTSLFRIAYPRSEFEKTKLFAAVKKYLSENTDFFK